MYERSAIVLERYIENILKLENKYNMKTNYKNYENFIQEIEEYQEITANESKVIEEFDNIAKEIENIQKNQEKLYQTNKKYEEERNKLFGDLGEESKTLNSKFEKIEKVIDKNNQDLKELREEFIKYLSDFAMRQIERNKCEKARRLTESKHIANIKKMTEEFSKIEVKDILSIKQFITQEKEDMQKEIFELMIKNGKNEKIGFNQEVIKVAISARLQIAQKEAECYVIIYDKMKKLLSEIENDNLKLDKYKKTLKNISAKLNFIEAQKEYIVGFLDNERMTAISGLKAHNKMMEEACNNFTEDMAQISNLYELILREIANKATKKAYKELYNNTYLKSIEAKEKSFEKEVNNIRTNAITVINSNYWRIEGIKNIYNIFKEEVTNKFEKDLSEYEIVEEPQELNLEDEEEIDFNYDEQEDLEKKDTKNNKNTSEKTKKEQETQNDDYDEYEDFDEDFEDEEYDEEEFDEFDDFEDDDEYDDFEEDYDDETDLENKEYDEDDISEDDEEIDLSSEDYEDYEDYEEDENSEYDDEYDEDDEEDEEDEEDEDDEYEIEDDYEYEDEEDIDDEEIENSKYKQNSKAKNKSKKANLNEKEQKQATGIFNKFFKERNSKSKNKRNN